jgi:hypothetical protein
MFFFFFFRCVCVECVCFGFACVFSFRMFLSFPFVCMCACDRTTVRRYLSPILLGDGMYMTETFRWLILTHTEDLYTRTLDSKFQFRVVLRSMASPPYSQRCRIVRCLFLFYFYLWFFVRLIFLRLLTQLWFSVLALCVFTAVAGWHDSFTDS